MGSLTGNRENGILQTKEAADKAAFPFRSSAMPEKQGLLLYLPAIDELDFRRRLLADPETMSYNHAWGGTIDFPESDWAGWYAHWVLQHRDKRFYRYLKTEDGTFVGEVAYHFDPKWGGFMADVIVKSEFRGRGYGKAGLELLCAAAKMRGITVLYDDIAIDNPAIEMFLAAGFFEVARTDEIILLKKDL